MHKFTTRQITLAAAIGAAYAALTLALPGLAFGPVQIRFGEALTVLPFLFPEAVPGLFVGCLIANLISPYGLLDVICGAAATLIAAMWTSRLKSRWLAPLPPILCNGVIIGAVIAFSAAQGFTASFPAQFVANGIKVALDEIIPCYVLGMLLLCAIPKLKRNLGNL